MTWLLLSLGIGGFDWAWDSGPTKFTQSTNLSPLPVLHFLIMPNQRSNDGGKEICPGGKEYTQLEASRFVFDSPHDDRAEEVAEVAYLVDECDAACSGCAA